MRAVLKPLIIALAVLNPVWSSALASSLSRVESETRTVFFNDIYELTVWTPSGDLQRADLENAQLEKRMELLNKYGGDLPDIPKGWTTHLKAATDAKQMDVLRKAYNDLEKGDVLSLTYAPDTGSEVRKNGSMVISAAGHTLTSALLKIWFGYDPVSESIKDEFMD